VINAWNFKIRFFSKLHILAKMSYYCCVPNCCNNKLSGRGKIKPVGFSFHEFPCNVEFRLKWTKNICRENWTPGERDKICSRHFTKDSFKDYTKIKRLKPDAIPTLFQNNQSKINSTRKLAIKTPKKRESAKNNSEERKIKKLKTDIIDSEENHNYIPVMLTERKYATREKRVARKNTSSGDSEET